MKGTPEILTAQQGYAHIPLCPDSRNGEEKDASAFPQEGQQRQATGSQLDGQSGRSVPGASLGWPVLSSISCNAQRACSEAGAIPVQGN